MDQAPVVRWINLATWALCFAIGFGSGIGYTLLSAGSNSITSGIIITSAIFTVVFGATGLILTVVYGKRAYEMLIGIIGLTLVNLGIVLGILLVS